MTCTKEQLLRLSDWLNDNLQFDKGEDFNKLSEAPDDDLCKTDKATVSQWLDLMAELIPQLPNGSTLLMQNNARRMKLMSNKLKKQLHKSLTKPQRKTSSSKWSTPQTSHTLRLHAPSKPSSAPSPTPSSPAEKYR